MIIRFVGRLFPILVFWGFFLASCTSPAVNSSGANIQNGLLISWSTETARSIYPDVYPQPASYDLLLKAQGQSDVVTTGITQTSWNLQNLARVNWTITVTGRDPGGKAVVQGGTTADLTASTSQSSSVTLQYLGTGTGSGSLHLTLDLSEAPVPVDVISATITDPMGITTHPAIAATGSTASFVLDPAPVGAYNVYFFVEAGTQSQGRFETAMVFQNVATVATMKFLGGNFDTTFHPVTGVALDQSSLDLYTNGIAGQLTATVSPGNANNPGVAWKSSAPAIATVTQQGVVVPVSVGTTTVSVSTSEGSHIAACEVTVGVKHVTGVSVSPVNLTLVQQGSTGNLVASAVPVDASPTSFAWSSSDTSVATVDGSGVVTPLLAGTATITATSLDGSKTGSSTIGVLPNGVDSGTVSVVQPGSQTVSITVGPRQDLVTIGTNPTFTGVFSGTAAGYQWFVDGYAVVGATSATFVPSTHTPGAHTISLAVTGANGLLYSSDRKVNVVPGFLVSYDGNGATGGTVPVDTNGYPANTLVSVQGSSVSLLKTGYVLAGWMTKLDGTGTSYAVGASLPMGSSDVTLYAVWIPASVTFVGSGTTIALYRVPTTFSGGLTIPPGVTAIGRQAFFTCGGLTSVNIPTSVTSIGDAAFYGCTGLTSVIVPGSVTTIGQQAFYGCSYLQNVTLLSGVTSIGSQMFLQCVRLTNVTIPSSVTSIGDGAFYGCGGLTNINLPPSLVSIGDGSFMGSGLAAITIPSTVNVIGGAAFRDCWGLISVTIPSNVTTLGQLAFKGCNFLTSVTMESPAAPSLPTNSGAFDNVAVGFQIHVPSTQAAIDYQAAPGWSSYSTSIVTP